MTDVKPDNVLVNWTGEDDDGGTITDIVLGDFDITFKSQEGKPRNTPYATGNVMWRSPEGHTGRGTTKVSDIFAFGLVVGEPRINPVWNSELKNGLVHLYLWWRRHASHKQLPGDVG